MEEFIRGFINARDTYAPDSLATMPDCSHVMWHMLYLEQKQAIAKQAWEKLNTPVTEKKFISIYGRGRSLVELERYLYSDSVVVSQRNDGPNNKVGMIVEAPTQLQAQHQADRYGSGLIGARLHYTKEEADKWLHDLMDY